MFSSRFRMPPHDHVFTRNVFLFTQVRNTENNNSVLNTCCRFLSMIDKDARNTYNFIGRIERIY